MKIKSIINEIEKYCPINLAIDHDKDRIGLQVGDINSECKGIVICLDFTKDILQKAIENDCNLIITHHPFIYYPMQKVDYTFGHSRLLADAIINGVTVYSTHTNMDRSEVGINRKLIEMFDGEYVKQELEEECIFKATCKEISLCDFAKKISSVLDDKSVKVIGNLNKKISSFAICGGGGGSADDIELAMSLGVDAYISGDFKHSSYLFAKENDFACVEFSHYSSEIIVEKLFYEIVKKLNIKTIIGKNECPYKLVEEL